MHNSRILPAALGAALGLTVGGYAAEPQGSKGQIPRVIGRFVCPVLKVSTPKTANSPYLLVNGERVYLCCPPCSEQIKHDPAQYIPRAFKDPVTGKPFKVTAATPKVVHGDALFLFNGATSRKAFQQDPRKYVRLPRPQPRK